MRLQLLSDVHVEFHADGGTAFVESLDPEGVDVLVLAGDIAVGDGIADALGLFCQRYAQAEVLYVHGNHEYYGRSREHVRALTRAASEGHPNLTWLDTGTATLGDRRFLGGPLWFAPDPAASRWRASMADFQQIPDFESWVYEDNARMLALLDAELRPNDIVVTHHLPTQKSVAPPHVGSPLNPFFVCDVEPLMMVRQPALWLHGHTHWSVDVTVGKTRVRCNPFGYVGLELNTEFQADAIIDV